MAEWRKKKELTQEQLADRLGVDKQTVSRWERYCREGRLSDDPNVRGLHTDALAAIAEALDRQTPGDLYRNPDQPSADELMRDIPPERRAMAMESLEAWRGKKAS